MLSIYPVAVELLRELRPAIARIETSDRDLARQMRRAAASVLLNLAEGSGSFGGTGRERFRSSLGSLRETDACLDVAVALGYLNEDERRVSTPKLGRVAAALVKLASSKAPRLERAAARDTTRTSRASPKRQALVRHVLGRRHSSSKPGRRGPRSKNASSTSGPSGSRLAP